MALALFERLGRAMPPALAADTPLGRWLPWLVSALLALFLLSQLTRCGVPMRTAATPRAADTGAAAPRSAEAAADASGSARPAAAAAAAKGTGTAAVAAAATTAAAAASMPQKVFFAAARVDLGDEARAAVATAARWAATDVRRRLTLTGYADRSGDAALNAQLARRRALAVRDALQQAGVDGKRITVAAPVVADGAAGAAAPDAQSRRVEIRAE